MNRRWYRFGGLALLLALGACGGEDPHLDLVQVDTLPGGIVRTMSSAPTEPGAWSLIHERDVRGVTGGPGELLDPESLALADDGTLYVIETNPALINVYAPDGSFVRHFGRSGAGPGEFSGGFLALRGDSLVLHDPQQARSTVYQAATGEVLSIRNTTCCYWNPIGVDGQGRAWVRSIAEPAAGSGPGQVFVRFAIGGTAADTVTVPRNAASGSEPRWTVSRPDGGAMFSMTIPFMPQAAEAVDPTGGLVTGYSSDYILRRSRDGRDTVALFGRPRPNVAVTAEERRAAVEARVAQAIRNTGGAADEISVRKAFDPSLIPDTRPAFENTGLYLDQTGRTWVRRSLPDTLNVHLDLFGRGGVWLAELTLASPLWAQNAYRPVSLSSDHLALLDEDADGLPIVRIFRLDHAAP